MQRTSAFLILCLVALLTMAQFGPVGGRPRESGGAGDPPTITTGTIAIGTAASNTGTISPSLTDTTKTLLLFSMDGSGNGSPTDDFFYCELTNTTTVTCGRDSTGGDVDIRWWTLEWATASILVQRGSTSSSSNPIPITLGTAVDSSQSWCYVSQKKGGSGLGQDDPVTCYLTAGASTTGFNIKAGTGASDRTAYWQVIEYDGASVQTNETAWTTETSDTWTLGQSVTLSRAFLTTTVLKPDAAQANTDDLAIRSWLSATDTVSFDRDAGNENMTIRQHVVELPAGHIDVQTVDLNILSGNTSDTTDFTAVTTLADSIPIGAGYQGGGLCKTTYAAIDVWLRAFVDFAFVDSDTVQATRSWSGNPQDCKVQVIEWLGGPS